MPNPDTQRKPKTRKGKRALEKRLPKEVEDAKRVLILQGNKATQAVQSVLTDLWLLKRGQAAKLSRKNPIWPFEPGNETSIQFLCERADCAMFCLGNHNKKRPNNLVLGRTHNAQLLDMLELGLKEHVPITVFPGAKLVAPGAKPCFLFVGEQFELDEKHKLAKAMLLDLFRGDEVTELPLMAVSRLFLCLACGQGELRLSHYAIVLKKSGTTIPRVELQEAGPRLHLTLRRSQAAPPDLMQEALKVAPPAKKSEKNESNDEFAGRVGRIYMPQQDLSSMALAKGKGVKRERRDAAAARKERRMAGAGQPAVQEA